MAPDCTEPGAPPAQRRTRRTILVGVDGSRNATNAFDSALIIAGIRHLEILLVGAFTYPFAYLDPYDPAVADEVLRICADAGLTVLLRHVRGHQVGGGRTWVNNLCDSFATAGRKSGAFLGACEALAN